VTNSGQEYHAALGVLRRQLAQDVVCLSVHAPEQLVDELDERAPQTRANVQRPEGRQRHDGRRRASGSRVARPACRCPGAAGR
jgi:hypothetical protein